MKIKKTCAIGGYTVREIYEKTSYSLSKCRYAIKLLLQANYVAEGAMIGNSKAYYITEEGIQKIEEINKESNRLK